MTARAHPQPVPDRRTKVLIIDDSALVRQVLSAIINREKDMIAIGAARDPYVARELIRKLEPDVLTLDIEMPRMDGLDFLEKLMRLRPMPVVLVSTLTEHGAEVTLRGLELGAVDFVAKPRLEIATGIERSAADIVEKVRAAAHAHVQRRQARAEAVPAVRNDAPQAGAEAARAPVPRMRLARVGTEKIVFIGASTGGTEAIREVLVHLPPDAPGVVVTQHMPPGFTHSFAQRLDSLCRIRVKEAEGGERVLPGHAYIAPGDRHLEVIRSGADYLCALSDGPLVNRHRPSVEVLFRSAMANVGANAIGIMLTGMGKDGAQAMLELRQAGAYTIAQDEKSSVVWGMPGEAVKLGAVEEILPLHSIAAQVLERVSKSGKVRNRV